MADDRRSRDRRRRDRVDTGTSEEFEYRGHSLEELEEMSLNELAEVLPARARRTIDRGLTDEHEKFIEKVEEGEDGPFRTHLRDMIVLPSFVGSTILVYDGSEFESVRVEPDMIGHYLGEFVMTREDVEHTGPGVGATRSSKYMPLK
jgi:small subunit ribosomal protein S19